MALKSIFPRSATPSAGEQDRYLGTRGQELESLSTAGFPSAILVEEDNSSGFFWIRSNTSYTDILFFAGEYRKNDYSYCIDGSTIIKNKDFPSRHSLNKVRYRSGDNFVILDLGKDSDTTFGIDDKGYLSTRQKEFASGEYLYQGMILKNVKGLMGPVANTTNQGPDIRIVDCCILPDTTVASKGILVSRITGCFIDRVDNYYDENEWPFDILQPQWAVAPFSNIESTVFCGSALGLMDSSLSHGSLINSNAQNIGGPQMDTFTDNYFDAGCKLILINQYDEYEYGTANLIGSYNRWAEIPLGNNFIHEDATIEIINLPRMQEIGQNFPGSNPNAPFYESDKTVLYTGTVKNCADFIIYNFSSFFTVVNDSQVKLVKKTQTSLVVENDSVLIGDNKPDKVHSRALVLDFKDSTQSKYDLPTINPTTGHTFNNMVTEMDGTRGVDDSSGNDAEGQFTKQIDLGIVRELDYNEIDWGLAVNEKQFEEYGLSNKTERNRNVPMINQGVTLADNNNHTLRTAPVYAFEIRYKSNSADSYSAWEPYLYNWPVEKVDNGGTYYPSGDMDYTTGARNYIKPKLNSATVSTPPIKKIWARYIEIRITVQSHVRHN